MELNHIEEKMNKTISVLQENFSEVRAGRANPAILNKIRVDYYGTPTPINQVAGVSVPEARLIVIQPWDATLLKEIEKEILKAEIGINPNNDGKVIRLAFPELTEERRKEIVKDISSHLFSFLQDMEQVSPALMEYHLRRSLLHSSEVS